MAKYEKADIERRMKGAVESLKGDLSGLRTGRANTSLLDPVMVEVYGAMMPLNQVATVSAPEPRMLSVQVWDKSNLTPVEKGIAKANLGLNPMIDGQTLRLPLPDLTEERRKELAKLAGEYGEKAKIAIRNVRRDGMEALKDDEKKKDISEDERKRSEDDVQKITDSHVAEIDVVVAAKVKEILSQ
ncbi:MAG: ribosome recycling factor [Tsuneonella sp.]